MKSWFIDAWYLFITPYKVLIEGIQTWIKFERQLLKLKCLMPKKNILNLRMLAESYYPIYQDNFRIYLDEYPEQKNLREQWLKE
ncbi:MAG: hypothetical protein PVG65_00035 [Candidatus Thorarchaeota archaeon]|jgi:hypothetical protein